MKYAPITPAIAPLAPTLGTARGLIEQNMGSAGRHSADQVEHQIPEVSEVVFDVVAEDPQEEHVPRHV